MTNFSRGDLATAAPTARRTALATVAFACLAMMASYLPFSAANGALGRVAAATGAGTADLQWVTDAFAVALSVTVLSAGALAERYGRRRITVLGLLLTVVGSLADVAAGTLDGLTTIHLLWAGQALAGVGAGLVMSATLALIAATASSTAARTRAISLWAAAVVVGLGAGPFLVAAVMTALDWYWSFAPIAAIALGTLVFGISRSSESLGSSERALDLPGQVTGALGIAALAFGAITGGTTGWASLTALLAFALAAVSSTLFVVIEHRSVSPVLSPLLFRSPRFVAAGVAAAVVLFAIAGDIFVLSLFFSSQHLDGLGIAVRLGGIFLGNLVASLAAGGIQLRLGGPRVLVGGLLIGAAGMASLLGVQGDSAFLDLFWRLVVFGFGCGLVMATSSAVAIHSVTGSLAGMAGAANNALRQLGAALGPAVLGVFVGVQLGLGGSYLDAVHAVAAVLAALFAAVAILTVTLSQANQNH
ncbi:MFS transporter [Parafrigoribacterium soli]|uniref:MFS transporter n=1 Tax=Parafrigoribacterium soli TaxID=3144663 RepID=UPI0032EB1D9E